MRNAQKTIIACLVAASLGGLTGCVVDADRDHDHRDRDDREFHDRDRDIDHSHDHDHDRSMSQQPLSNVAMGQTRASETHLNS
jgi:hypothetical protein